VILYELLLLQKGFLFLCIYVLFYVLFYVCARHSVFSAIACLALRLFLIIKEFLLHEIEYLYISTVREYMDLASYWIGIYGHKSNWFPSRGWASSWKFTIPRSLYPVTNIRSISLVRVFHPFPVRKARYFTGYGGCLWWKCAHSRIHRTCNDVTGEHCAEIMMNSFKVRINVRSGVSFSKCPEERTHAKPVIINIPLR